MIHKKLPKSKLIPVFNEGHWGTQLKKEVLSIYDNLSKKLFSKRKQFYL